MHFSRSATRRALGASRIWCGRFGRRGSCRWLPERARCLPQPREQHQNPKGRCPSSMFAMQCPWPPCRMLPCVTVPLFTALKLRSLLERPNTSSERILREREMRFAPDPVHVRSSGRSSHLPARGHSYSWPLRSAGLGPCMSPCGGGERAIDCYEASSRGPPGRLRTPPLSSAADRRAGSSFVFE